MSTTYTEHYSFGKQENYADLFSMKVITDNWDSLDAILYGFSTGKQDKLSDTNKLSVEFVDFTPAQIAALGSGITDDDVEQIDLNKNNISYIEDKGAKNLIPYPYAQGSPYTQNYITYTADDNGIIHVSGTISGGNSYYGMILTANPKPILQDGEQYILFIHATGTGKISQFYINEVTSGGSNSLININDLVAGDYVETINFSESENSNGISCIIKNATSNTNPIDMYLSIMICKKTDWDISHTYQPYAMSSAELTAKEQQNESDISTEQAKTVGMTAGGTDYITVNGIRFYVSSTTPTGTIPVGSIGVGF